MIPRSWFNSNYTGKPEDYKDRFVKVLEVYGTDWPRMSQQWAKSCMTKADGDFEKGLAEITVTLVDDVGNFQGTKGLSDEARGEIVQFLLSDKTYKNTAHEKLDGLVVNSSTSS